MVRPPSFSLSAWTCDGGRRTFIDMQASEQRPFQGAKFSVTGHVKKASPIINKGRGEDAYPSASRFSLGSTLSADPGKEC
jgi:hypothetical protein